MLRGDEPRDLVGVRVKQGLEPEHDARARDGRGGGPGREGRGGVGDGGFDLALGRVGRARGDEAGRRVVHVAETPALSGDLLAADEVLELLRHISSDDEAGEPPSPRVIVPLPGAIPREIMSART